MKEGFLYCQRGNLNGVLALFCGNLTNNRVNNCVLLRLPSVKSGGNILSNKKLVDRFYE